MRPAKYEVKTEPRQRPTNYKQQVIEDHRFTDIRLAREHVAEFRYRPCACDRDERIVVVWKDLEFHKGIDVRLPTIRTTRAATAAPSGQALRTLAMLQWQERPLRIRLFEV